VDAEDVAVTIEGAAGERVVDVASWSSDHAGAFRLRGSAKDARLEWRARTNTPAWLTMTGGSFTADGTSARFLATSTSAFGVPLGAVGASFALDADQAGGHPQASGQGGGLTIEAGKRQGSDPPVVAVLKPAARPPTLGITLRPVEVSSLGTALGVPLPARGALASGRVDLTLGKAPAGISGTAALDLEGWVPQHPRSLDSLLGKKSQIRSRLRVSEDRATIKLDELSVRAGRVDLKGAGTITEEGGHAVLRFEVEGPVPCADLARTMASQELGGGLLGGLAGEIAGGAIGGSASLKLSVEADTRDLGAARVTPRVGVGCKLQLPGL
jgi:hypothetical protein